jgi:signal transduction histidine kinase
VGERESRERLAVADERTRIARELRAVVAASVSAVVVQTEVSQHRLDEAPEGADDARDA